MGLCAEAAGGELMKLGMLTTWNTQCGIAEYSRALVEALSARGVDVVVLGSRNYDERSIAEHEDYVVPCFDVERWNRYGHRELDVERILDLGLDVLHVQYQLGLYPVPPLVELLERFDGASVITWHDNWVPVELEPRLFAAMITHRPGVGLAASTTIPHGLRRIAPIVRTFGMGRTREDVIAPICERNGWAFESAATAEPAYGGQRWLPWRELHEWLRGADAIVLWYPVNELVGASGAAHSAIATRRPVIVNDLTWFEDLPERSGAFRKVPDDPAALEEALREILAPEPLIEDAAWEIVAERHLASYRLALSQAGRTTELSSVPRNGGPPAVAAPAPAAPPRAAEISDADVAGLGEGDLGHLHRAFDLTAAPPRSTRRLIGRPINKLRRAIRRLLWPVLDVQSSVNAANARVTSYLLHHLAAQSRRIADLERGASARAAPAPAPEAGGTQTIPPESLIRRSGWTPGTDVVSRYLSDGSEIKATLAELLAGRPGRQRVLDYGCGVAKTLRHFAAEKDRFELHGCDIDGASIDWLESNHSDYGTFARIGPEPALPYPDSHFDLVYAISVFTHLADDWAAWLLELRRVLRPDGVLAATVLGEAMAEAQRGGVWDADSIGMNVLRHGQDWEGGGPTVFHSAWWLHEHWGRAFEITEIRPGQDADGTRVHGGHDIVIATPRQGSFSAADLEALDVAREPREVRALQRNIEQLHADDAYLRGLLAEATARGDAEHEQRVELQRQLAELHAELERSHAAGAA